MKTKTIILTVVTIALTLSAIANWGTARFSVVVIDDNTETPIPEIPVIGVFLNRYMRWENATEEVSELLKTDAYGRCHFSDKTNCGDAGTRVRDFPGYYDSEIITIPYTNKSRMICHPIWLPDNVVVTLRLQRVEHPIPLFVKTAVLHKEPQKIIDNKSSFAYDLFAGDWLPPFGKDKLADIEFTCNEREQLPDGRNFCGMTDSRYKSSVQVKFTGSDNGLVEMPRTSLTLKIREAVPDGYHSEIKIWQQPSYDLQTTEGYDASRNYCFRIRTRKDKDGNIVEAYYGKIYRDIELIEQFTNKIPDVAGVKFSYYLNPTSLDRNLEFDTNRNLNTKEPIPPCALLTP